MIKIESTEEDGAESSTSSSDEEEPSKDSVAPIKASGNVAALSGPGKYFYNIDSFYIY